MSDSRALDRIKEALVSDGLILDSQLEEARRPSRRQAWIRIINRIEQAAVLSAAAGISGDWSVVQDHASRLIPEEDSGLDEDLMYMIELAAWPTVGRHLLLPETWHSLSEWIAEHVEPQFAAEDEAMLGRFMEAVAGTLPPFDIARRGTKDVLTETPALSALQRYLQSRRSEDAQAVLRRCAPLVAKGPVSHFPIEAHRLLWNVAGAAANILPPGHRWDFGSTVGKFVEKLSRIDVGDFKDSWPWYKATHAVGLPFYHSTFPALLTSRDPEPVARHPLFVPAAEEHALEQTAALERLEAEAKQREADFFDRHRRRPEGKPRRASKH